MAQRPRNIIFEHLLRELAPQVLGSVIRRFHDFTAAQDVVQEALVAAVIQWPHEGVPDHPRGWLIQVAVRRMADYLRSEEARRREADRTTSLPERNYLMKQAARLSDSTSSADPGLPM